MDMYRRGDQRDSNGQIGEWNTAQGFMLQGGKMQGSSGSTEFSVLIVFKISFLFDLVSSECNGLRSGSDEGISQPWHSWCHVLTMSHVAAVGTAIGNGNADQVIWISIYSPLSSRRKWSCGHRKRVFRITPASDLTCNFQEICRLLEGRHNRTWVDRTKFDYAKQKQRATVDTSSLIQGILKHEAIHNDKSWNF